MTRLVYFSLIFLINICSESSFSQNDLNENINLNMVLEKREKQNILVCTLENQDSIGFWVELFSSEGNNIIIMNSMGNKINYSFNYSSIDSSLNYIYPRSNKKWEYDLTSFFTIDPNLPDHLKRKIPKGEYRIFWEVFFRPTLSFLRSEEIIFNHEPLTKK